MSDTPSKEQKNLDTLRSVRTWLDSPVGDVTTKTSFSGTVRVDLTATYVNGKLTELDVPKFAINRSQASIDEIMAIRTIPSCPG